MHRLEHQLHLRKLLSQLNRLYECRTVDQLPGTIQHMLLNTVPCDFVGWYNVGEDLKIRSHDHLFDGLAEEFPHHIDDLQHPFNHCPFTEYDGKRNVLRLSDFPKSDQRRSAIAQRINKICPLAYHVLGARLRRPGDGFIALTIKRKMEDFTDAEILLVEEVLEHIERHATALGLIRAKEEPRNHPDPEALQGLLTDAFALTVREAEVTYWAAQGKCNQTIATILGISPHTVRTHLMRIFEKMDVENRASLAHAIWNLQTA